MFRFFSKTSLFMIAGGGTVTLAVACGSALNDGEFSPTGLGGADTNADGSTTPSLGGNDGSDAGVTAQPTLDGSVVLVHASRNLPAFRVCFDGRTNILPLPDDKIMPAANVVGVDVGSAVHLGALVAPDGAGNDAGISPFDAGTTDLDDGGDGGEASAVDSGPVQTPQGPLYVMEEKLVRSFYPQGTDAQAGPGCGTLVDVLQRNGYEGHGLYTLQGAQINPSNATQFVVISGCLPDATLTATDCGKDFTAATGNLQYSVLAFLPTQGLAGSLSFSAANLSPSITGASVSFADTSGAKPSFTVPDDTPKSTPAQPSSDPQVVSLPPDDASYAKATLTLTYGAKTLSQSLADVQSLSSPRDLPSTYFSEPSNFMLFVVGDANVDPVTSPTLALHFLAVPASNPATFPSNADQ